jgi:hypothetical protein
MIMRSHTEPVAGSLLREISEAFQLISGKFRQAHKDSVRNRGNHIRAGSGYRGRRPVIAYESRANLARPASSGATRAVARWDLPQSKTAVTPGEPPAANARQRAPQSKPGFGGWTGYLKYAAPYRPALTGNKRELLGFVENP